MSSLDSFKTRTALTVGDSTVHYFSLTALARAGFPGVERLPYSLKILLENLLANAWKFTSTRGEARIGVHADGPNVVVEDNGVGFDMTYVHQLFTPFRRLHGEREFPGTGIGLATVARIVQKHGGSVSAEGAVGRGAKITFRLDG